MSNKQNTINLLEELYEGDILEYNIWAKIHNSVLDIKEDTEN